MVYKFNLFYLLQWKFLKKLNPIILKKKISSPHLKMNFSLNNIAEKDYLEIITAIHIIEIIVGQRPVLIKSKKKKKFMRFGFNFNINVDLRKCRSINFLTILKEFILPWIKEDKSVSYKYYIDAFGNYNFSLKNLIIFPGLEYKSLKWSRSLKFNFLLININEELSFNFFEHAGLLLLNNYK